MFAADYELNFGEGLNDLEYPELFPAREYLLKNYYEYTDYDSTKVLVDNKAPIELTSPSLWNSRN